MRGKTGLALLFLAGFALDPYLIEGYELMVSRSPEWMGWATIGLYVALSLLAIWLLIRYTWLRVSVKSRSMNLATTYLFLYVLAKISFLGCWLTMDLGGMAYNDPELASKLMWVSLGVGLVPMTVILIAISTSILSIKVYQVPVYLPNLPKAFEGYRIAQFSDLHLGSYHRDRSLRKGILLMKKQRPDLVVFTGDLVNLESREIEGYEDLLAKMTAPDGTLSILGNHDYGLYKPDWGSEEEREDDLENMKLLQQLVGWDLLLNENRILEKDGERIAIIGVENWGLKFTKRANLHKALEGTEGCPVKILLSHDPTHWERRVTKEHPDIDLTLAGHTHGFQLGLEFKKIKVSPARLKYKYWAGLYNKGKQLLYVNRGFGYLGYPGRFGVPSEITIFTLTANGREGN